MDPPTSPLAPPARPPDARPTATARGGRLPLRIRLAYGSASISGNALSEAFGLWLIFFYAPPPDADIATRVPELLGVGPRVVFGAVLTLARAIESIDDPVIGYLTDRTRSRWGRRIPYILFGTPWWIAFFVLLFTPPAAGSSALNLIYLFVVAQLYFLLSNVAGAAMEALLPHLARSNADRVSVAGLQLLFGVTGAALGLSLSSLLVDLVGFAGMALTVGAIALGARYVALFGTWRYAVTDSTPCTPGLRRAVANTFRNPNFLAFLPSFVFFQVGRFMLTALLPFYVAAALAGTEIFGLSADEQRGTFTFGLTVLVILGILVAVPGFSWYARQAGKAAAYRIAMLGSAVAFPLLFFAGFIPGIPVLLQAGVAIFLAGIPISGVFLFPNILTADIVDDDAAHTGTRREAMFYGSQNLVEKLATSLSPLIFALVLLAGDSAEDPLGVRLVGPVAGLLVLAGYLSFRGYRLEIDVEEAQAGIETVRER